MLVKDQLNREISLSVTPRRIVSLVPSQTELLVDLGLKTSLVGITKFCVHPKNIKKEITVVGGTKEVDYAKIEKLQPDIIICNREENTQKMVTALERIAPVWVSDIVTIDDSLQMIESLGILFGVTTEASKVISFITSEIKSFQKFIADKPLKKVVYLIWNEPYMAAGSDTFIHSLLLENNFQNTISEKRYPEVTIEQLDRADLVLLSSEPYPFKEKHIQQLKEK